MGIKMTKKAFDEVLKKISAQYKIFAPVSLAGANTFSDNELIRYEEVKSINEIEFDKKSQYSAKEIVIPITQTLFYFTEDQFIEPKVDDKDVLVFLRSCDIHSFIRLDEIYLRNKFADKYYKVLRDKIKFVLIGCNSSFDNCFCVSMDSNKTENYQLYIKPVGENVLIDIKDKKFEEIFKGENVNVTPDFVVNNQVVVQVPNLQNTNINNHQMWREYDSRCIACGRCNFVCPTCTCYTMQDIIYKDNENNGERRRVWASCHVDGYTDMAGGHSFRKPNGDRMRFKVMHKVYDYKKRFGYHMCVGCGRCDDVCPQYISFSNCVNKLNEAVEETNYMKSR
ncbi:MAG: anaerobic sulfite reductase subunit AsrA [Bacillota bacterium]|nr:anaerobic sulfite reductase subunit AsrA [Bacillota bacterium]